MEVAARCRTGTGEAIYRNLREDLNIYLGIRICPVVQLLKVLSEGADWVVGEAVTDCLWDGGEKAEVAGAAFVEMHCLLRTREI